ncbi:DinB family protein [Halobacillus amylolyticus]|uniref:DinB family protein n=1 Tax=Halobacillus amylolyticus TaxID=2932259 RepID=UPI002961FE10|nr:DinB family protein [Halobacillus amylolyticus]
MQLTEDIEIQEEYQSIRTYSERLVSNLETEDFIVQAATHVSPTKWHLAHTTWFFEKFILEAYVPGYQYYNSEFLYLFNSYYETVGTPHPQAKRGLITRPTVKETMDYRKYVDTHMEHLLSEKGNEDQIGKLVEIGLQHEQQHQELILMDIKYNFSFNPLYPVFQEGSNECSSHTPELVFHEIEGASWRLVMRGLDLLLIMKVLGIKLI